MALLAKKDIIQCEEANYLLTTKYEDENMHFYHTVIRTNKILAKCWNSFIMKLIKTFPFMFFLVNLEKHFPSLAAFDDLSVLVLNTGVLIIFTKL